MKKTSTPSRKGSALLIVLGMLSFMVISAVGFSIYMRQSRVPSSHLRREATARYLLKSALANAVARLDGAFDETHNRLEGVYDDVYPGLNDEGNIRFNGDYWANRVFTPFGLVEPSETVSTLTLEGLAYLPPAIINEVRLRSRTTGTARWRNLAYDLGRYAFCAVDVSDCFDINKLAKVKRRTSFAGERISISALYPDDADAVIQTLTPRSSGNIPYVSVADYNVSVGASEFTPFVRYIQSGGNNGHLYLNDDEAVSNALFITDTWFPATNAYLTAQMELKTSDADAMHFFDLSDKEDQPFEEGDYGVKMLFELPTSGGLTEVMYKNLGPVGLACLYDYLDDDQLPFSLALPTVEAAPMICGFGPIGDLTLKFEEGTGALPNNAEATSTWTYQDADQKERTIERTIKSYCFRGAQLEGFTIAGTAMLPFKRLAADKRAVGSFKAEALVGVFFAEAGMRARLTNRQFRPTKQDWQNGGVRDGIVFFKSSPGALSFGSDITRTDEAFASFTCQISGTSVTMPAFYKVSEKETTVKAIGENYAPLPPNLLQEEVLTVDGTKTHATPFTFFNADGEISGELTNLRGLPNADKIYTGAERQANPGATKQNAAGDLSGSYRPVVAVWVRIVNGNGRVVDLSPASFADDSLYIDGCNYGDMANEEPLTRFSGKGVPMLPFKGADEFKYEEEVTTTFDGSKAFEPQGWKALFAVDPRYNFAPEDWFGTTEESAAPERWKTLMGVSAGGSVFGKNGRDRDIFMFTSDQKHLQSIGELQFLPFVQRLGQNANSGNFDFHGDYNGNANFAARSPSNLGDFANGERFWRTYSGYEQNAWNQGANDPYYDLRANDGKRITVVNGTRDFRVNPFSPDERVMAAAVFDTPWDYYIASTNRETNKAIGTVEGAPERFAFGTEASMAADRWSERQIAAIANEMSVAFRSRARTASGNIDWGDIYRNLDWECAGENVTGDEQRYLFNDIEFDAGHSLHGVDRKFLFSYWRECFQNRQQLFLIFMRAEPLTVGGAGGDSLATSQLGARGVALVWRDPAPPKSVGGNTNRKHRNAFGNVDSWKTQQETCPPHRTRVLFYHQFD